MTRSGARSGAERGGDLADFDALGGADRVAQIMGDLVDRMSRDFIIGYLFEGRDLDRVKRLEAELAGAHLGGPARYSGRPVGAVHRPLRISRGHFRRRVALLEVVLRDHGVAEAIRDRWIRHDLALEPVITDGTDCVLTEGVS